MNDDDVRRRRILSEVMAVPRGAVATYGQIAEQAGLPRRARLVGRVLAQIEASDSVPWHRIVSASGRVSLPPDSPAFAEQCQRLRVEGVVVESGRVSLTRYRWQPDLDELLWRPREP